MADFLFDLNDRMIFLVIAYALMLFAVYSPAKAIDHDPFSPALLTLVDSAYSPAKSLASAKAGTAPEAPEDLMSEWLTPSAPFTLEPVDYDPFAPTLISATSDAMVLIVIAYALMLFTVWSESVIAWLLAIVFAIQMEWLRTIPIAWHELSAADQWWTIGCCLLMCFIVDEVEMLRRALRDRADKADKVRMAEGRWHDGSLMSWHNHDPK